MVRTSFRSVHLKKENMAKLIIERTSEWNNRMRDIGLYLDGEKIGVIGNGKTKEFDIEPGEHQLWAKIDWCGSRTLNLNLSDTGIQKVKLSGFKYGKWLMPVGMILIVLYFVLGYQLNINPIFFLIFIIPIVAYLFYYLTFGRDRYLRLKKI